ncbi:unnamed protein product, partial [Brenthis ino]
MRMVYSHKKNYTGRVATASSESRNEKTYRYCRHTDIIESQGVSESGVERRALVISGESRKSLITFVATPRRRSAGGGRQSVPRSGCAQACAGSRA